MKNVECRLENEEWMNFIMKKDWWRIFCRWQLFEIFDYKLIEGDPKTVLNAPRSLVISEAIFKQLFYNENPIGKAVRFKNTGVNPIGIDHGNKETD